MAYEHEFLDLVWENRILRKYDLVPNVVNIVFAGMQDKEGKTDFEKIKNVLSDTTYKLVTRLEKISGTKIDYKFYFEEIPYDEFIPDLKNSGWAKKSSGYPSVIVSLNASISHESQLLILEETAGHELGHLAILNEHKEERHTLEYISDEISARLIGRTAAVRTHIQEAELQGYYESCKSHPSTAERIDAVMTGKYKNLVDKMLDYTLSKSKESKVSWVNSIDKHSSDFLDR